ncbi:MAG: hypothetical protein IGS23_04040 [Rivularia sp. T60_A2020_040]|nr:hypothetical protein [Rivularia sp. T60_A2020_040]
MKKNKLIGSIILPIAVILPALFPLGEATAQQQKQMRPISLLRANCVKSGIGSVRMEKLDISIGKAVYNSKFYLSPGYRSAALTCKIKPDNRPQNVFETLNLGFGMRDNNVNSPSIQIKFYLDGQPTQTVTVAPTQAANLSLNVNNVSNVAIEATCSSSTQYCSRVYFYDADLQRKTPIVNTNPVQEQILEAPRTK